MFTKVFRSILAISILNISLSAIACVKVGESVGSYPGAPDCCEGLALKPAPEGVFGSAGTCVKKSNCVEAGEPVGSYPGAPDCCEGLTLKPAPEGVFGSAGTCMKKSNCVEAGESVGSYPSAPDCCKGLELQPPAPGVYGSAGTCVESRNPPSINVNDSQIQSKDSVPGIMNSPSTESRANKQ